MTARSNIRKAAVTVAAKIRDGREVDMVEELTGGDLTRYVEDSALKALRKDRSALRRAMRDGLVDLAGQGFGVQMSLPGMDHAGIPAVVFHGQRIIPASLATLDQIDAEVSSLERRAATRGRVISGWRATVDHLRDSGVDGGTTGAEIAEMFPAREAVDGQQ